MNFKPISLMEMAHKLEDQNPEVSALEWTAKLTLAEELKKRHARCTCGNPIWAVGSALSGSQLCFVCLTGESDCSDDYEIEGLHEFVLGYGMN